MKWEYGGEAAQYDGKGVRRHKEPSWTARKHFDGSGDTCQRDEIKLQTDHIILSVHTDH